MTERRRDMCALGLLLLLAPPEAATAGLLGALALHILATVVNLGWIARVAGVLDHARPVPVGGAA